MYVLKRADVSSRATFHQFLRRSFSKSQEVSKTDRKIQEGQRILLISDQTQAVNGRRMMTASSQLQPHIWFTSFVLFLHPDSPGFIYLDEQFARWPVDCRSRQMSWISAELRETFDSKVYVSKFDTAARWFKKYGTLLTTASKRECSSGSGCFQTAVMKRDAE